MPSYFAPALCFWWLQQLQTNTKDHKMQIWNPKVGKLTKIHRVRYLVNVWLREHLNLWATLQNISTRGSSKSRVVCVSDLLLLRFKIRMTMSNGSNAHSYPNTAAVADTFVMYDRNSQKNAWFPCPINYILIFTGANSSNPWLNSSKDIF